mgnify:CR=1 FL=1
MFHKPVIVSMARTAVGSFGGSLRNFDAVRLGTIAAAEALRRARMTGDEVDEVVFGCVGQYGVNAFLARLISVNAGVRKEASAQTVNRLCASGLQAIVTGAMLIESGDADVVLAGGAESMSNYPYLLSGARWGMRMGVGANMLEDALTTALCEPFSGPNQHICITAENIARRYGYTREQLDAYALESQRRARAAIDAGLFRDQIVPVEVKDPKQTRVFDADEHPRNTSMEKLARLKPLLGADGLITAGNASGVNDAAAAVVLMSESRARSLELKPLARIVDFATAGVDPMYMGLGPVASTRTLARKTGLKPSDFDLTELNEAFASQAMACIQDLELDLAKVNPNGSGISLGHPIGATGAVITVKLLSEMLRRGANRGLATLCIGGGQGMSAAFERV